MPTPSHARKFALNDSFDRHGRCGYIPVSYTHLDVYKRQIMARAATQAAGLNVKVNGAGLKDRARADAWAAEVDALVEEVEQLARAAVATAGEHGGA